MNFIRTPIDSRDLLTTASSMIENIHRKMSEGQESMILHQLNDFIGRGLIVIESESPVLIRDELSDQVAVRQAIRLALKDQEYIQKLETENAELKAKIDTFNEAIKGLAV